MLQVGVYAAVYFCIGSTAEFRERLRIPWDECLLCEFQFGACGLFCACQLQCVGVSGYGNGSGCGVAQFYAVYLQAGVVCVVLYFNNQIATGGVVVAFYRVFNLFYSGC